MKRKVHYLVIGKVGNRVGQGHNNTGAYTEAQGTFSILSGLVCYYYSHIPKEALLVFYIVNHGTAAVYSKGEKNWKEKRRRKANRDRESERE